jgi:hypothetical protein
MLLKSDIEDAYKKLLPKIRSELDKAHQDYKKAKDNATVWRDEFLISLATSRAKFKGTDADAELRQL